MAVSDSKESYDKRWGKVKYVPPVVNVPPDAKPTTVAKQKAEALEKMDTAQEASPETIEAMREIVKSPPKSASPALPGYTTSGRKFKKCRYYGPTELLKRMMTMTEKQLDEIIEKKRVTVAELSAARVIKLASKGTDQNAVKAYFNIAERLEGRPAQTIDLTTHDERPVEDRIAALRRQIAQVQEGGEN